MHRARTIELHRSAVNCERVTLGMFNTESQGSQGNHAARPQLNSMGLILLLDGQRATDDAADPRTHIPEHPWGWAQENPCARHRRLRCLFPTMSVSCNRMERGLVIDVCVAAAFARADLSSCRRRFQRGLANYIFKEASRTTSFRCRWRPRGRHKSAGVGRSLSGRNGTQA